MSLDWNYNEAAKTLTVSGSGKMSDYSARDEELPPWNEHLGDIETIVTGLTSITYWAFPNCTNLSSITIPEGVTIINDFAFHRCTSLTSINIPKDVARIQSHAFAYCENLTDVYYPSTQEQRNAITIDSVNEYPPPTATPHVYAQPATAQLTRMSRWARPTRSGGILPLRGPDEQDERDGVFVGWTSDPRHNGDCSA